MPLMQQSEFMVSTRFSGWDGLEPEKLSDLSTDDFECFCADLVYFEATERHDDPGFDGPTGKSVPDGSRDFLLTVKNKACRNRTEYQRENHVTPLTEDQLGRTAYSCKTGNNWMKLVLRDIERRKEPGRAIEVLLKGGHFKLMINQIGKLDQPRTIKKRSLTPPQHIVAALFERMRKEDPDAEDPSDRFKIIDADHVCRFLRGRQPDSLDRWMDELGLRKYLYDFKEWKAFHSHDRDLPVYVPDDPRQRLRDSIVEFLRRESDEPSDRIAWLVGAPGSGKTRLLLESLRSDESLVQRVRYSADASEVRGLLHGSVFLASHRSAVIVVDDCPLELVKDLELAFIARSGTYPKAHMVVLTPVSPTHVAGRGIRGIDQRWDLHSLEENATRDLVSRLVGEPEESDVVSDIVRLSEGFPWYAALLAEESRGGGSHPRTAKEAAQLGLASGEDERKRPNIRLHRARALLAATMTRKVDWDELREDKRRELALAVGLQSFENLRDLVRECNERGIIRLRRGWAYKYVTPLVLERELLMWLLGPAGDDPSGRRHMKHARDYVGDLLETILRFDLPQDLVGDLAERILTDLCRAPASWTEIIAMGLLDASLQVARRYLPGPTASELRRRVEASSLDELSALEAGRRQLVFALEDLSSRRESFEDAEAALFRLALAENETYANNAAGVWAGLFSVGMNVTHRSIDERLKLLERRLGDSEPAARLVALTGLNVAMDMPMSRTVPKDLDGAWPAPTAAESIDARSRSWSLLATRFDDDDEEVAGNAKKNAIEGLRRAVRLGDGEAAMAAIASRIRCFSDIERVKLVEAFDAVKLYDMAYVDPASQYPGELEQLLAPRSYRDRLRRQVGVWRPGVDHAEVSQADESIAREGLADDRPLLEEIEWLMSEEAVRGLAFAVSAGTQDESGSLLEPLKQRACAGTGRKFFANYLWGWSRAGRHADAIIVLENMERDPDYADAFALSIVRLGASDHHVSVLEKLLRVGWMSRSCVYELGRPTNWLDGTSEQAQESLVETILQGEALEHAAAALELMVGLIKKSSVRAAQLKGLLLQATERLSEGTVWPMTEHYWQKAAAILVDHGEAHRVAELAVKVISQREGRSDHGWKALRLVSNQDPSAAWSALAATLQKRDRHSGALLLEFKFNRQGNLPLPSEEVLEWVADDEQMGRMAAALIRPHDETLHPILRGLVLRFGANSSVAKTILAGVHSTNGLVASLAAHDAAQLRHARGWLDDKEPEIARFAERLITSLEGSHSEHAALEEIERREMGS